MSYSPETHSPGIEDILVENQFKYLASGLPLFYVVFIFAILSIAVLVSPAAPPVPLGLWVTALVGFGALRGLHWRKLAPNVARLSIAEKSAKLAQTERIGLAAHFAMQSILIFVVLAPDPILHITPVIAVWATTVGVALYLSVLPRMAAIMVCAATAELCAILVYTSSREGGLAAFMLATVACALVAQLRRNFHTFKSAIEVNVALDVLRKDAMRLARTDALTGLANRRGFDERCAARIAEKRPFALAAIDLDGFKLVNDTHGHDSGDEVLKQCANRLHALDEEVFAARIGGDEFVLMVENVGEAESLVWKAVEALNAPYAIEGCAISVGVSSGLTFWLKPGDENGLLKRADGALYRAKEAGPRAEGDGKRSLVVH